MSRPAKRVKSGLMSAVCVQCARPLIYTTGKKAAPTEPVCPMCTEKIHSATRSQAALMASVTADRLEHAVEQLKTGKPATIKRALLDIVDSLRTLESDLSTTVIRARRGRS